MIVLIPRWENSVPWIALALAAFVQLISFEIEFSLASPLKSGFKIVVRLRAIGIALLLTFGEAGGVYFVFLGNQECYSLSSSESEALTSFLSNLAYCSAVKFW